MTTPSEIKPAPTPEAPRPERIDPTFRNGSITAVGIIVAFSLGFLSAWASDDSKWTRVDLIAIVPMLAGAVLQLRSLARMLSRESLQATHYDRSIRLFLTGLILATTGIAIAIAIDAFQLSQRAA